MTMRLNEADLTFFKENGYLIKRGVMDPELMARARETLWASAPPELDRNDPSTWVGPFANPSDDRMSLRHGFSWKFRQPGSEPWMVRMLPRDPNIWAMAEQLLGEGNLEVPERIRGIYCQMPEGDREPTPYHVHVDRHAFHLGLVGYIDDVEPDGGGFTVWPGSHRRFYYSFTSQYEYEPAARLQTDYEAVNGQPYVDCHGRAGDIVFWHHRLGHSAGHNRSANIRQAVLYDFKRKDLEGRLGTPPQENMWADWPGLR